MGVAKLSNTITQLMALNSGKTRSFLSLRSTPNAVMPSRQPMAMRSNIRSPPGGEMAKTIVTRQRAVVNFQQSSVMGQFAIVCCGRLACTVQPRRPHHKLTHYAILGLRFGLRRQKMGSFSGKEKLHS